MGKKAILGIVLTIMLTSVLTLTVDIRLAKATSYPEIINTKAAGWNPSASGNIIAFTTVEGEAGQDLNDDGDMWDWVPRYYDTSSDITTNTPATGTQPSFDGDIIAFVTYDTNIGQDVICYYDISTSTVVNTGIVGLFPSTDGNIIAFDSWEEYVGEDLNGDGDTNDDIIRYYDIPTGTITNTGAVGRDASISGGIIAFTTRPLIRYYNISTGAVVSTGAIGDSAHVSGSMIAFWAWEDKLGYDWNGDGDTNDSVIGYYNTSDSTTTYIKVGWNPSIEGHIVAFTTSEADINQDLNRDGDLADSVIRYYDVLTSIVTNTGAVGVWPSIGGDFIAFETGENWINEDLNEDGDLDDRVIRYLLLEKPLPDTMGELKTEIEEYWQTGEIDNHGIIKSLIVKLNVAQKLVDKGMIDEAKSILGDDFIPQVQELSGIHITVEAADILIKSAEYIMSHL